MIRQTIEKGTPVFHEALGFGLFVKWNPVDITGDFAHVCFDDGVHNVHRKRLTEIKKENKHD